MKKRKILFLFLVLSTLVACAFAISSFAATDNTPRIISKNISYDNDLKFLVAVPKDQVTDSLTFTVSDGVRSSSVTMTKEQLSSDALSDPTLGGVECYAIMSDFGVPLKDMAKRYTLTVTSGGKTSDAITYSVAEYLYERLFKNGRALAYENTADADRSALYFSTLTCGANAERVLYNRNSNPDDDITTFADEYLYSNVTGAPALYKRGDKVTLDKSVEVYKYTETAGVWTRTTVTLPAGENTIDAHMVISKEYGIIDFEDGLVTGDYVTSNGVASGATAGGNDRTYYEVINQGVPGLREGKVLKVTRKNDSSFTGNTDIYVHNTSDQNLGTIYVFDFDAYFSSADVTNTTRTLFQIYFGSNAAVVNVQTYSGKVKIGTNNLTPITLNSWGSFRVVYEVVADGSAKVYIYYKDAESGEMVLHDSMTVSSSYIKLSGVDHITVNSYNSCQNSPYVYYLDNVSFARTSDTTLLPFKWTSISSINLVSEETGSWQTSLIKDFKTNTRLTLASYSASSPQSANELCIGNTGRPISDVAYDLLEQKLAACEYDDPDGYVIYVEDGSIALAYTSDIARSEAIKKLLDMSAEVELVVERGVMYTVAYSLFERAGESREAMYQRYFDDIEKRFIEAGREDAEQIVTELARLYSLYDTETLLWIANLYDIERGGFYFSNSARDTVGFLPDLESTSFALSLADNGGLFAEFGGLLAHGIPEFMREPMTQWIRSMQDPDDGCFYHPQWGKENSNTSRIGRDIDSAIYLLNRLKANPMYAIPGNSDFTPTGPDTVSAVALTARLSAAGTVSAVSSVVATASLSLPSYLKSLDAWQAYLEALNINGDGKSYPAGNTLCSMHRLVREADDQYEAAGGELAAFSTMALNFLNETQIPEIGLWEYQNKDDYDPDDGVGYNGTNGLMKISVAYGSFNNNRKAKGLSAIAMPNSYNALVSAVKVAKYKNTSASETVCYVLNIWTCVGSALGGVKSNDPENYEAAKELVLENLADMINSSYGLLLTHKMPNGGFKYYESSPCNSSQSMPVAYSPYPEADMNATTVATTSTINALFGTIRGAISTIPSVPLWCADDYYLFMDTLENLDPVDKSIPDPYRITFDDYVVDEESAATNVVTPNEYINVQISSSRYQSSGVVSSTRPGATADDKVLKLQTTGSSTDCASGPMNAYITYANELLEVENECYLFETDLCINAKYNGDLPMQLFFYNGRDNTSVVGFNFLYENGSIKIQETYDGPDGTKSKASLNVANGSWFTLTVKVYKTYTVVNGQTKLTYNTKVYVNGSYLRSFDGVYMNNGEPSNVSIGRACISCYRKYTSTIYVDNIYCEKLDEAYS